MVCYECISLSTNDITENLRELAIMLKQSEFEKANEQLTVIHEALSTINTEIPDNPKQCYKHLHEQ